MDEREARVRLAESMGREFNGDEPDFVDAVCDLLADHDAAKDAYIKKLKGELECARQVAGEECDVCGWAGVRGDLPCAFCAQNVASYSGDTNG